MQARLIRLYSRNVRSSIFKCTSVFYILYSWWRYKNSQHQRRILNTPILLFLQIGLRLFRRWYACHALRPSLPSGWRLSTRLFTLSGRPSSSFSSLWHRRCQVIQCWSQTEHCISQPDVHRYIIWTCWTFLTWYPLHGFISNFFFIIV